VNRRKLILLLLVAFMLSGSGTGLLAQDKSMAKHKFVLQLSDGGKMKQTLVLNVARNLIRHYGNDVHIEIVAFGPGLRLLFKSNGNRKRISNLNQYGVRFSACKNTIKGMGKKLGHPPVLNAKAVPVGAGVVRIYELVKKGYMLVRP